MRKGDILGSRYRLDERIDGGAMGEVWKGTDNRLNRTVAVKILHASLSTDKNFRQRFQSEARSAAVLRAPGVVDLYDYGEETADDDSTVCFLVMEFVDGRPLSSVIADKGRLSARDTMTVMAKCATALDAAHRAGIIHRDIKPGNILLTGDNNIKVVDFGIARAQGQSSLTATGQVMGTVSYVSPDQLYDIELTGVSDLYSLGVVAYECLSGVKPFQGDVPAAIITAQLHQDPPPLPADVPAAVRRIVLRCMEKEPEDRYADGATLSAVCSRVLAELKTDETIDELSDGATRRSTHVKQSYGDAMEPVEGIRSPMAPTAENPKASRLRQISDRNTTMIAAACVLIVLMLVTAVWRPWERTGNADPIDDSTIKVTGSPVPDVSSGEPEVTDDAWYPTSAETSLSESEDPTSESPSPSEPPDESDEPTDPEPTDEPTSSDPTSDPEEPDDELDEAAIS